MKQARGIIVLGPTASGKTSLAIEIAKYLNTEVVSFDSRQFFKEMSIGTAVPSKAELSEVKHHFIHHKSIHDDYNAGMFAKEAEDGVNEILETNDTVVMVGGSGLYIDAYLYGIDSPPSDSAVRNQLAATLKEEGLEVLVQELKALDPEAYSSIDKQNPVRVQRALEIIKTTGAPLSRSKKEHKKLRDDLPFQPLIISPKWEREQLYTRINKRVDLMIEEGLEDEARLLSEYRLLKNLQTVGYREFFDFFDNRISKEEAIRLIKRNTRRYAKRQLTWLRNKEEIIELKQPFFEHFKKYWQNDLTN